MMSFFTLVLFVIVILLQTSGQILERYGMTQVGRISNSAELFNIHTILQIVTNHYVLCGVTLSAIGLFFWLGVLSNLKISYIYPLGAVSYIVLALLAHFILKEGITETRWIGICVIVIGCYLINR